jgi:hypothetical protein
MFRFESQCIGLYPYFYQLTLKFNHHCVYTLNLQVVNFKKSKKHNKDKCFNDLIFNIQDHCCKLQWSSMKVQLFVFIHFDFIRLGFSLFFNHNFNP